jgi:hypothetical protein
VKINVVRKWFSDNSTIGEVLVDKEFFCYSLEDTVRKNAAHPGKTAIPKGRYKIMLNVSHRFNRVMPEILNVPGYSGIRIHPGNDQYDTSGCILVGYNKGEDVIWNSKKAFEKLFSIMEIDKDDIIIEVS